MSNSSNKIRYLPSEQKYLLVNDNEPYSKFNQIINKKINRIDNYEKLVQLKRSIDSLIEILYSNSSFHDIETELDTTKRTQAKLESQKRIQDRKRKIIESIIKYITIQQQEINDDAHSSSLNYIKKDNIDICEIKNRFQLQMKEVLLVVLANRVDPEKRAGETEFSNAKHAELHGRKNKDHKQQFNIFSSLLKLLLSVLFGINMDMSLRTPFTVKVKAENQKKKGISI